MDTPVHPPFYRSVKFFKIHFECTIFIPFKVSMLEYSAPCIYEVCKLKGWLLNVVTSLLLGEKKKS